MPTVLKVMYGWGLRCTETSKLDTVDFTETRELQNWGGSVRLRADRAGSRWCG